ncbi:MAG: hypothetical protein RR879_06360 [Hydrogenoanaerobacterium sp.]
MKLLVKKLRCSSGETLVETLVAVLVMTCASVLFATMLLSASHMNNEAQQQDIKHYEQISAAEAGNPLAGSKSVTITENVVPVTILTVTAYGTEGGIVSYRLEVLP